MDCKVATANHWSKIAIGAAIEVHRLKGAGLLESIYEKCLARELQLREVPTVRQFQIRFEYKGVTFAEFLRLDFYIDDCLLLELKAVERVLPIHKAQLFSYMKLLKAPVGLLINFHETTLKDGIHRLILPGTQTEGYPATFDETEGSGEVSEQKKTKATENRE
jgi:GxxExxY protein